MTHLEIAVAAPLAQTLTYAVPESLDSIGDGAQPNIFVGRRVLVPLSGRKVTGYVVSKASQDINNTYKVREIIKFLDDYPLFHSQFVAFYQWVANYYHYPLGLVIKTALPGGLTPHSVKKILLNTDSHQLISTFEDTIPEWVTKLSSRGILDGNETKALNDDPSSRNLLKSLLKRGFLSIDYSVQQDSVRAKKEICFSFARNETFLQNSLDIKPTGEWKQYAKKFNLETGQDLKLSEVRALYSLRTLSGKHNREKIALKELRKEYSGSSKALASLEERGVVSRSEERVYRSPFGQQLRFYPRPEQLTSEQCVVLEKINPAINQKKFKPFLLHGITGSGKTEVYLRAAEETLRAGRDVLILVPEIALATQLEAHLLSRFGDLVVLHHSGLSAAEKFDQYHLALTGKAKIVIGARSAIFAPLSDPGLIIVDEEHDSGFKQDDTFRYHGRDLAVLRARHHDCVVILGSATPSVTSYANARSGKYTLLTMVDRVGNAVLPGVTTVDLSKEKNTTNKRIIKAELLEALESNLEKEKQSILLLNRRGFSSVLLCRDCGTPVQCSHCHVSLTLHKGKNRLLCHYCGYSMTKDTVCLQCTSINLVPAGFGTERVEEEVQELLPDARVQRLDSDTATDRKKFLAVLSDMHDGNIDILIGTQMVAKGHHFPNVTLVGIVWADGGMSMPDFRAAERTFQLITQVTGRAGRGEVRGEVIIQTLRPDHYSIVFAKNHDYLKLFEQEMRLRKNPLFPPYVRLIGIRIQGRVESDVRTSAIQTSRYCREVVKNQNLGVETLGPAPSPLDKIKDKYRWQILLKGSNIDELHALCTALQSQRQKLVKSQCSLIVDVDPENMM